MAENNSCENPDEELIELLKTWGYEFMFDELKSESVSLKRLRFLTESDITHIFRNHKVGEKAEFRHHLSNWKREKGYDNIPSCSTLSIDSLSSGSWHLSQFSNSPDDNSNNSSDRLKVFLTDHPEGYIVTEVFAKNAKLNDAARKILIEAIVSWHIKKGIKICRNKFINIAKEIQEEFNEDKAIYYQKIGNRPSGRLYDKYYNTIKRLKTSGGDKDCAEVSSLQESQIHEESENEAETYAAHEWVKVFTEPWNDVQENWKKCFKKRRAEILNVSGEEYGIADILNKWKLFSHSMGHNLINIDFKILYPKATSLLQLWDTFKVKIVPILNKLRDPQSLQHLEIVKSDQKGSNQYITLLLHALLRPNIKRKADGSKSLVRSTVKDSQDSFILCVRTLNDVQHRLEGLKTSLYHRGETLQPLIIAVGLNSGTTAYYIYYDEIKYASPSFLHCFDTCFQIYHVLNLRYPKSSTEFWTFVQIYFYGIQEDKVSANVLCLLNDLK